MHVDYRVLGPLEARGDGRTLDLGGRKQRATLALLLLAPNTLVPVSRIVDGLGTISLLRRPRTSSRATCLACGRRWGDR